MIAEGRNKKRETLPESRSPGVGWSANKTFRHPSPAALFRPGLRRPRSSLLQRLHRQVERANPCLA